MSKKTNNNNYLTWAEIDLKALKFNLKQITRLAGKNKFTLKTRPRSKNIIKGIDLIMPVIKADAYGHGMGPIASLLNKEGVGFFGVSDINEGVALRQVGIKKPILLFESTLAECAQTIVDYKLTPTVCTLELAKSLNEYAQKKKTKVDIHVKVDTGMGRLGIWHEEAYEFIQELHKCCNLRIMGIFTHFPAADTDKKFTQTQLKCLYDLVTRLDQSGLVIPYIHAANSVGLAGYETHIVNLSRPGIMLYGLYPHLSLSKKICLKPVLKVNSRVIFLKEIKKGRSISYGRTFFTKKDMLVATIPIGYNDGYFRAFSNKSFVLIEGLRCPVIGRVTMDQIMIDVSHLSKVKLGTPVVILGAQKKEFISADELAEYADTINYEIVCSLGNRLPRVYRS